MKCKSISLENFRNVSDETVSFSDGVNIIIGDNAQGKTNLLEAIYFSALTKSFRTSHEAELMKFDSEYSRVSMDFSDSVRNQNITQILIPHRKKEIIHNGVKIRKSSDVVGLLRIVLFCPEHLSLIKEGPAMRRSYLDIAIAQLKPMYLHSLQKYNVILKERNQLIKNAEEDRSTFNSTIEFWSEQLAAEAAYITVQRRKYIERVKEYAGVFFYEMTSDAEKPNISYVSSSKLSEDECYDVEKIKNRYTELLSTSHDREIGAGSTLYGIHRDDIEIELNGKSARFYASQGQQRSLALALKLAEGEICREECGEYPIFLFDDVLSELDSKRKKYLTSKILNKQVIMTTCESDELFDVGSTNVIRVKDGHYLQ